MRSIFGLAIIILALSFTAFAQEHMKDQAKPTEQDKTAAIPADSYLKRGAPVGSAKKVSLNKALKDPSKYSGKTVRIEGVVVRSCKMEGCWAEVAENVGSKSVRVKM